MGIKNLKKEGGTLNLSLIDMLAKFDKTKTKKYLQFLVKMFNEDIERRDKQMNDDYPILREHNNDSIEQVLPTNSFENLLTRMIFCEYMFSWSKMRSFIDFTDLMERGLITEKDITKYNSWDMLEEQLFEAKNRELFKKSKKEIHKIYEDHEYLIFKPLTYSASVSYGYQTKWCTTMINDATYFYNHSKGVLIYLIDKRDNKKFAFYRSLPGPYEDPDSYDGRIFNTYNQEDKQIDTIQTGLPMNILRIIMMECDLKSPTTVPNYKLFSEDEKNEMRKHTGPLPEDEALGEEKMLKATEECRPIVPITQRLRRRIIPMPVREPHGEDETECIMEEPVEEKCVEDLKLRVEVCREELEEKFIEHLTIKL